MNFSCILLLSVKHPAVDTRQRRSCVVSKWSRKRVMRRNIKEIHISAIALHIQGITINYNKINQSEPLALLLLTTPSVRLERQVLWKELATARFRYIPKNCPGWNFADTKKLIRSERNNESFFLKKKWMGYLTVKESGKYAFTEVKQDILLRQTLRREIIRSINSLTCSEKSRIETRQLFKVSHYEILNIINWMSHSDRCIFKIFSATVCI